MLVVVSSSLINAAARHDRRTSRLLFTNSCLNEARRCNTNQMDGLFMLTTGKQTDGEMFQPTFRHLQQVRHDGYTTAAQLVIM